METINFNYSSSRAAQARIGNLFSKSLRIGLALSIIVLLVGGVFLLFEAVSF